MQYEKLLSVLPHVSSFIFRSFSRGPLPRIKIADPRPLVIQPANANRARVLSGRCCTLYATPTWCNHCRHCFAVRPDLPANTSCVFLAQGSEEQLLNVVETQRSCALWGSTSRMGAQLRSQFPRVGWCLSLKGVSIRHVLETQFFIELKGELWWEWFTPSVAQNCYTVDLWTYITIQSSSSFTNFEKPQTKHASAKVTLGSFAAIQFFHRTSELSSSAFHLTLLAVFNHFMGYDSCNCSVVIKPEGSTEAIRFVTKEILFLKLQVVLIREPRGLVD